MFGLNRRNHRGSGGVPGVGEAEENTTDEDEAVERARAGDRDAYAFLVARYSALAHRTAYLLGAGHEAEDVTQEAFVKAYRALDTFRPGAAFRPWLLRIVANETRNSHRTWRRRSALELRLAVRPDEPVAAPTPEQSAVTADTAAVLLAAINAMADRDRLVLACRYFLDLSEAETAQVLAWPRGSVKSRLSRALAKLRQALPADLAQEVTR
ncbi:RNA polymerase sigma factor [Actinophytocola sp.]|uniref:RNA polymerase sigma factor n=1 Tax=Actinophytocola sp. TaxID=1872138 RepID=UPI00389B20DA